MPGTLLTASSPSNIYEFPDLSQPDLKDFHEKYGQGTINMGDVHSNPILIIYSLVVHGAISNMTKEKYDRLVALYFKPVLNLTAENLKEIDAIIRSLTFNPDIGMRLIGDELCDRGPNDYFILKLLEKMNNVGFNYEILISNHGVEFYRAHEEARLSYDSDVLQGEHKHSIRALDALIEEGFVERKEVRRLTKEVYAPKLKIISSELDDKGIRIYSHAAIGINTIHALANKFKVTFNDETPTALHETINAMNIELQNTIQNGQFSSLINPMVLHSGYEGEDINMQYYPIEFTLWNRNYSKIPPTMLETTPIERCGRPAVYHGYDMVWVHGHDTGDKSAMARYPHIINLDNPVGKNGHDGDRYWVFVEPDDRYLVLHTPQMLGDGLNVAMDEDHDDSTDAAEAASAAGFSDTRQRHELDVRMDVHLDSLNIPDIDWRAIKDFTTSYLAENPGTAAPDDGPLQSLVNLFGMFKQPAGTDLPNGGRSSFDTWTANNSTSS